MVVERVCALLYVVWFVVVWSLEPRKQRYELKSRTRQQELHVRA